MTPGCSGPRASSVACLGFFSTAPVQPNVGQKGSASAQAATPSWHTLEMTCLGFVGKGVAEEEGGEREPLS